MSKLKIVAAKDVAALLDELDAMLLDCRAVADYQAGHLEGALHVHEELVKSLMIKEDKSTPLVLYCYKGYSSAHLGDHLVSAGYPTVYSVEGGYEVLKTHK